MFDILASENGIDYYEMLMGITTEITEELLVPFDFQDTLARYVKVIGHGNSNSDWNSFSEFEVWGWNLNSTSINNSKAQQASIYPNPCKDLINVKNAKNSTLNIYNSVGKLVFIHHIYLEHESISIPLKKGIYFYKITNDDKSDAGKIMVE